MTQEKHKMLKSQQIRASMIYKFCLNTTCVRLNVAAIQESEECSSYYYSNFTLYSVLSFYFGHCLRRSQHLPQWKSCTGNHMFGRMKWTALFWSSYRNLAMVDSNLRPLNSIQTLYPTELTGNDAWCPCLRKENIKNTDKIF